MAKQMTRIPLLLSGAQPCSYLDEEFSQSAFVHPDILMSTDIYAQLISQGFRRSGDDVYTPYCRECSACIPVRIPVKDFKPNRSQKRCANKHLNTQVLIKPAQFEQAHYYMYLRYQHSRHTEGSMADASPDEYINFLSSSWCDTLFIEFTIANELAGIAVVDQFENAWSAVYTFFEPKLSDYSLGVYAVLWQIKHCMQLNKEFLYLGFWIEACRKMNYKTQYQPLELLINQQWQAA